jgi:two-component system, OmpR family, sensor kinase
MRSLFAKILLWFLATIVLAFVGFTVIATMTFNDPMRQPPIRRAFSFHARAAQLAYEKDGREALRTELEHAREAFQADAILTDSTGRDLVTGENRTNLIAVGRRRFFLSGASPVFARKTSDGRYWFILAAPGEVGRQWLFPTEQLWVLGSVILLCYLLARYLTSPLRSLQTALERFGQGDFSARTGSTRRDELGQLARTFDHMAERIENLVGAQRRLLLDISHELRSPLARLGVAVELARSGADRDAALDRIQKEADRLNALVGELLQVTRAEVDPQALRRQPVRLDDVLANVVGDCSIEAAARGCSLVLDAPAPVTVAGDPELLRRATENVIRNAIRFAPPQTRVEVRLEPNGSKTLVRVRDYGPGVPEESLGRIFEPFYRVEGDRNRGTGGVGLGLAIARRAIELHKGEIHAHNAQPGLIVEMDLPLSAPRSASGTGA